jgi:hypothetical protein
LISFHALHRFPTSYRLKALSWKFVVVNIGTLFFSTTTLFKVKSPVDTVIMILKARLPVVLRATRKSLFLKAWYAVVVGRKGDQ